jgi:hypothetical protein
MTKIRTQTLQNEIWSTTPIWNYNFQYYKKRGKNRITKIIKGMNTLKLTITNKPKNIPVTLQGGQTTIEKIINDPKEYNKIRNQLKNDNIMFMEQIINNNPNYVKLRSWSQIAEYSKKGITRNGIK